MNCKGLPTYILIPTLWLLGCGSPASGGGETPAIDIPSPVSQLISVASPNEDGNVRVTGLAGAADANSTVTITNTTQHQASLIDYVMARAWAVTTLDVTANADGSFQGEVEGQDGDTIEIALTLNAAAQTVTKTVPELVIPLPTTMNIQDVAVNASAGQAVIVSNDGTDGFVHLIDLNTNTLINTTTLTGASGANRIASDPTNQNLLVIDPTNVAAWAIQLAGNSAVANGPNAIVDSVDVAAGTGEDYMIIVHTFADPLQTMSFFDMNTLSGNFVGNVQSDAGSNHQSSLLADVQSDGANDLVGLVSLFDDDIFYLTTHQVDEAIPSLNQQSATALTGLATPGGIALLNNASEALITDRDNDVVLRVNIATDTLTTIEVGDNPQGVSVSSDGTTAFVVNSTDATLSIIDLASNRESDTVSLGLTPTQCALDPSGGTDTVVIINTGDETVSLIPSESP